jgi:hypothetical protein
MSGPVELAKLWSLAHYFEKWMSISVNQPQKQKHHPIFVPLYIAFLYWLELASITNRIWGNESQYLLGLVIKRHCGSLESLALEKASCHAVRMLKQPYGEVHKARNRLLPVISLHLPGMWISHLGRGFSRPGQASRCLWSQPMSWL